MLTKTIGNNTFGFLEVPVGATDIQLHKMHGIFTYNISYFIADFGVKRIYITQTGTWQILGKPSELSEEQWKGIVPSYLNLGREFPEYSTNVPDDYIVYSNDNATESGLSLIASIGMKAETTLILKQVR